MASNSTVMSSRSSTKIYRSRKCSHRSLDPKTIKVFSDEAINKTIKLNLKTKLKDLKEKWVDELHEVL